jgi:putative phosphonate metabolism protein
MSERFAIYLVPRAGSALWDRGCRWLGRDPETGTVFAPLAVPGFTSDEIRTLTRMPRDYGFHATLKAPFRLAQGVDELALLESVARLARTLPTLSMPELRVDRLDDFLALRPAGASATVDALAARLVTALDPLRAPIDAAERDRRLSSRLSARQQELLERWGYPYVLEEFRFHMTLSGRLEPLQAARLHAGLEDWFASALSGQSDVVDVGVFRQAAPGAEFTLRRRFTLQS